MNQDAIWTGQYATYPSVGPNSAAAYDIFPRYRLARETLVNIERLVFRDDTSLDEATESLLSAGVEASQVLTEQLKEQKAAVFALKDELLSYRNFIEGFDPLSGDTIEQLPFRRVLTENEVTELWGVLRGWWGIRGAGYGWFPLSEDKQPLGSLTIHTDLWENRHGAPLFQLFLSNTHVTRCFVLRELGPPDYELDRELAVPVYDGSEIFLFTNADWIVYVSHESSLTIAGSAAAFFREQWRDTDDLAYGGPYSTTDLRGSW